MPKYKVLWRYESSLGGKWMKGDFVELPPDLAAAINVDSPGVLELQGEREQSPKQDRQLKAAPHSRTMKGRKNQ